MLRDQATFKAYPMLIVVGAVTARPDTVAQLTDVGIAHSRRSRAEPGCITHAVHTDCENPLRIFFYEEWVDRAALDTHFKVPDSLGFMRDVRALAASVDGPRIIEDRTP
jgi:quinol monooxygenase YgiN